MLGKEELPASSGCRDSVSGEPRELLREAGDLLWPIARYAHATRPTDLILLCGGLFLVGKSVHEILALSFLMLIGVALIADGLGQHISNMRVRRGAPVQLHSRFEAEGTGEPSKAAGST